MPTRFWHPFAHMSEVDGSELVMERGEGVWLYDCEDRRYLDALGGLWHCNVGHGRAELASAAAEQMRQLAATQTYGRVANRPALELAERLAELAPVDDAVVFLTNAGSDAIETAIKICRRYWNARGEPLRHAVVTRSFAYHGMNGYGTSLCGIEANTQGYGPLAPGVVNVPHDDPAAVERVFTERPGQVAAFLGEPVIGAGGVYPPGPDYWHEIQRLCREHDVLLIADEVVTAFGRLGRWFGCERFAIRPDIIACAKGLTSGYVPLGAVICSGRVREPFWTADGIGMFRHGYTYSGHPVSCAVALANLALLESEDWAGHVRQREGELAESLNRLTAHPLVSEIRACGFMAAVGLTEIDGSGPLAERLAAIALDGGTITRSLLGTAVQISPPLPLSAAEAEILVTSLGHALDKLVEEVDGTPGQDQAKLSSPNAAGGTV